MVETIVLGYGLLTSFVLSGATRNRKLKRPNPPVLEGIGHVLLGFSGASAAGLAAMAMLSPAHMPF